MAGEHPSHRVSHCAVLVPRPAGDQWLHVPHPPLEQPAHPPLFDPTNPRSPLKANVEN